MQHWHRKKHRSNDSYPITDFTTYRSHSTHLSDMS